MCVSAVLHRRAEPGDKNLSLLSVCFMSQEAGHMSESCAPGSPTGGLWGEEAGSSAWMDHENGETTLICACNRVSYKGSRKLTLFLFLYCTCWGVPCLCNDRLHFCVVQERGSLSLHQGSVNWHGYTPVQWPRSCLGSNQSTVSSGISAAHSTLGSCI